METPQSSEGCHELGLPESTILRLRAQIASERASDCLRRARWAETPAGSPVAGIARAGFWLYAAIERARAGYHSTQASGLRTLAEQAIAEAGEAPAPGNENAHPLDL